MKKPIKPSKFLTPFKRCVIQNFPFIEEDFDALTNYGLLCKIVEYLNKVIASQNEVLENVEILTNAFNDLKNYVDNYFDNLDVQDEINNKLDAMAEAGTLQEIIGEYLNATATWGFDSVADMKSSTNLIEGSFAQTLGYYSVNDGGSALYKIRKVTNDDVVDEAFLIEIGDSEDELVAELIVKDNTVNIKQLGGRSQNGDTKYDIKPVINKYLAKIDSNDTNIKLYIPSGIYHSTATNFDNKDGYNIFGDHNFNTASVNTGTVITTLNDNQEYLFKFGNGNTLNSNFSIKDITFSTADYELSDGKYTVSTIKNVSASLVTIQGCEFGDLDNLYFRNINGTAFAIKSSWEITFGKMYFRNISNPSGSIMAVEANSIEGGGINACVFKNMMFEQVLGHLIEFKNGSFMSNSTFEYINFEDYVVNRTGVTVTSINDDTRAGLEASDPTRFAMFKFSGLVHFKDMIINNIQLNNVPVRYYTIGGNNYVHDRLFSIDTEYTYFSTIVNNIDFLGMNKYYTLIYSHVKLDQKSAFSINNINNSNVYPAKFDVENFPYIRCDSPLQLTSTANLYRLPRNIIPAYQVVNNKTTGNRFIASDDDSNTNAKLCVKGQAKGEAYISMILPSRTFSICAKIPNGNELGLLVSNTDGAYKATTLTGDGTFKVYDIDVSSTSIHAGDKVFLNTTNGSATTDILIDYIIA